MSNPYVGEIRLFAGNFPPAGWMFCDGSVLPISENETLFTLIGTTYGGDGQETFQIPDLRGRIPVHMGQGAGLTSYTIGDTGGVETVTLTGAQTPSHTHQLTGSTSGATATSPTNGVWGTWPDGQYSVGTPDTALAPDVLAPVGDAQPHENLPPYLVVNFIISLFGVFPSSN
ncbi:phage tail protein [Curtobacterium sp. RRHDQ10]|uniref:phage tail protein n=1 Tax=Curtobacterium phyllosphaerae TaxID=3413379 RepID=UPI003BF04DC9